MWSIPGESFITVWSRVFDVADDDGTKSSRGKDW